MSFTTSIATVLPNIEVVEITPALAEEWLKRNKVNRRLKNDKIKQYAHDMSAGKWKMTAEAIKFSKDGRLIDGQNRLNAVIEANVPVVFLVAHGLDEDAQLVMDSGAVRSKADSLYFLGYTDTKSLAPAASTLMAYRDGFFKNCGVSRNPSYTKSDLAVFLSDNDKLVEFVPFAKKVQRSLPLPIGALATAIHEFSSIDPDATLDFFDRIIDMRTNGTGDPVQVLIKRVTEDRMRNKRLTNAMSLFYLFRAWNAYRDGEPLSKLQTGSKDSGWAALPTPH